MSQMSSLNELVNVILSDIPNSFFQPQLSSLLSFPLKKTAFPFEIEYEQECVFYLSSLPFILHKIFNYVKESQNKKGIEVVKLCTRYSKADVWLECVLGFIQQYKGDTKVTFLVDELNEFIFKMDRLIDFIDLRLLSSKSCSSVVHSLDSDARMLSRIPIFVANFLNGKTNSKLLDPELFVKFLMLSFPKISSENSAKITFLGLIISHLGLSGYSNYVSNVMLSHLNDEHLTALWPQVFSKIKSQALEICALPLLKKCPDHQTLFSLLFRGQVLDDRSYLDSYIMLLRRIFFVRYFPSGKFIRTIFGALYLVFSSTSDKYTFGHKIDEELGIPALRLWCDAACIQNSSIEKQVYISQILISWINDYRQPAAAEFSFETRMHDLLPDVLSGISSHLSSPIIEVRTIGMAVGEWLMQFFDWNSHLSEEERLKFEYEEIGILKAIRPFFSKTENQVDESIDENITKESEVNFKNFDGNLTANRISENIPSNSSEIYLDSDDDFEPTDVHHLKPLPTALTNTKLNHELKKPRYLRECLDGLFMSKTEDNLTNLACVMEAEKLIYAHPKAAKELAVDFVRAFIHLEPPVCPDQTKLNIAKHQALVAIGCIAPKECARYLTDEFCQSAYSIGQRLNILTAITDIACTLSLGRNRITSEDMVTKRIISDMNSSTEKNLISISKTRRFCSKVSQPSQSVNEFASVAGDYFFPLLRSIPQLSVCSVKGPFAHQDASLLATLLASLATIYACARFSNVQSRMASEFIELAPLLHRHPEPAVRRALLIGIGTVITTTPLSTLKASPNLLFSRHLLPNSIAASSDDGQFLLHWLKSCSDSDNDSECQLLAANGLSALCEKFAELGP